MDHVLVSFHSQAYPTLSTFLFSNTKNCRFRQKVTKAPTLVKASMVIAKIKRKGAKFKSKPVETGQETAIASGITAPG